MDEHNQNQANGEPQPSAPVPEIHRDIVKGHRKEEVGFMSGFIGVVIGALLVWFIMQGEIISKEQSLANGSEQKVDTMQTERISLDVNNDVTDIVEKWRIRLLA